MSVTIIPKNEAAQFLPNSAGWSLYGYVNALSGSLVYFEVDMEYPRPPDTLNKTQALQTAQRIELKFFKSDFAKHRLGLLEAKVHGLYAGELTELIREYVDWLRACGGYSLAR